MKIKIADILVPTDRVRPFKGRDKTNSAHVPYTALVESIREVGLQQPIVVGKRDNQYVLVAGRHRYEAHIDLMLPEIDATILKGEHEDEEVRQCDRRFIELDENMARIGLTDLEYKAHANARIDAKARRETRLIQIEAEKRKVETAAAAKAIADKKSPEYKAARTAAKLAHDAAVRHSPAERGSSTDADAAAVRHSPAERGSSTDAASELARQSRVRHSPAERGSSTDADAEEYAPGKFKKKALTEAIKEEVARSGVSKDAVERARATQKALGAETIKALTGTVLDTPVEVRALVALPEKKRAEVIKKVKAGKSVSAKAELEVIQKERKAVETADKTSKPLGAYQDWASRFAKALNEASTALECGPALGNPKLLKRGRDVVKELEAIVSMAKQGADSLKSK